VLGELGLSPGNISAGAVVVITVLMIFTARLVPKKYYDEALSRIEEERKMKEYWREAAKSLLEQNTLLLQKDDVSLSTLRAIRTSVEEGRDTS
jgi:hypothetical protein